MSRTLTYSIIYYSAVGRWPTLHSCTFSCWFGMELCELFPDQLWRRWLVAGSLHQRPCSVPGHPAQDLR